MNEDVDLGVDVVEETILMIFHLAKQLLEVWLIG